MFDKTHLQKSVSIGGYTSNHNKSEEHPFICSVFLLAVIHQTTTVGVLLDFEAGSVSIGGYTSNHNDSPTRDLRDGSVSIGGYTSNHN